jgi:hypothetical protein
MLRRILITLFTVLLLIPQLTTPALAGARTPTPTPDPVIQFGETRVSYDLPKGYSFNVTLTTPGVTPVKGRFTMFYQKVHQVSGTLTIDPAHPKELNYFVDASSMFIFPFVPLHIQWDITDTQGRTGSTGEQTIIGQDPRFKWQTLESDKWDLFVHYHDRDAAFGRIILEAAERSADLMEDDFDIHLARPIRVIVYNSPDEVLGYLNTFDENTGGQAFSHLGVTIQIIESTFGMQDWIKDVIPHEISHLYFFQATGGVDASWAYTAPSWLNEGLAEISANGMDPKYLEDINWQLKYSDYLPSLTYLDYNFNEHAEVSEIDYQMAYSITCYLVNAYGKDSIARILEEYANGAAVEEAFLSVLGINFTTLSHDWREASGLPLEAANYVEPTPTKTPEAGATATPTTPTPNPRAEDNSDVIIGVVSGFGVLGFCCFTLIILIVSLLIIFDQHSKKQRTQPQTDHTKTTVPPGV